MKIPAFHLERIQQLGYTECEARFLYIVATFSGYFTMRQFRAFSGSRCGKRPACFAQKLIGHGHARICAQARNASLFHLFSRTLYGPMDKDNLRNRKRPERIDDLRQHACLRLRRSDGSIAPWSFVNGNKAVEVVVTGPVIAGDFPTLLGAAMQGLGLAQVPVPVAAASVKAGRLARVLEPFAPMLPGVFLYYPGRRQIMPKLRAFIDHVKRRSDAGQKNRIHTAGRQSRSRKGI